MSPTKPVYLGEPPHKRITVERGIRYRWVTDPQGRHIPTYEVSRPNPHHPGRTQWETVGPVGITAARRRRAELLTGEQRATRRDRPAVELFETTARRFLAKKRREGRQRGTLDAYRSAIDAYLIPAFGPEPTAAITTDDIAEWVSAQDADGHAPASTRQRFNVLNGTLKLAAREGLIAANPVDALDRDERPTGKRAEVRVLTETEIGSTIRAAADGWPRLLTIVAVFTGLRIGEILGLRWQDIDHEQSVIHVRTQIDRYAARRDLKTDAGRRRVILMSTLAGALRRHRLASPHSADTDPVFASRVGTPLDRGRFRGAWTDARDTAGLPRIRLHDARHTFASILVAQGRSVVFVSKQLGHANVSTTLDIYSHLFEERDHADIARAELDAAYGHLITPGAGLRPV